MTHWVQTALYQLQWPRQHHSVNISDRKSSFFSRRASSSVKAKTWIRTKVDIKNIDHKKSWKDDKRKWNDFSSQSTRKSSILLLLLLLRDRHSRFTLEQRYVSMLNVEDEVAILVVVFVVVVEIRSTHRETIFLVLKSLVKKDSGGEIHIGCLSFSSRLQWNDFLNYCIVVLFVTGNCLRCCQEEKTASTVFSSSIKGIFLPLDKTYWRLTDKWPRVKPQED